MTSPIDEVPPVTALVFRPLNPIAGRRPHWPGVHGCALVLLCMAACDAPATPSGEDRARRADATTVRLSEEPTLSIGVASGQEEYELFEVSGAARLADGSIVVYESGAFRVQRFGPDGEHLWSRGQEGEGPGDFQDFAELLIPCTGEQSIMIYDQYSRRITAFDGDGELLRTYPFVFQQVQPRDITCAPGGRLVVSGWGKLFPTEPGPYRTTVDMAFADSSVITILREGVLAEDRFATANSSGMVTGSGPGIWSRRLIFAPTDAGTWLGTGDDYEIEFVDWTGATTRWIRWEGPDLAVTQEHLDAYRERLRESFAARSDPDWRQRFEARWESEREMLPAAFPAYSKALPGDDGVLWIEDFQRPGEPNEWFAFDQGGEWTYILEVPPATTLLDIGAGWALVSYRDALDIERLALHALVEN